MSLDKWKSDEKLIERISKAIRSGSVSHAYIIEGDSCVDKEDFAKDFLKAVCCEKRPGLGCSDGLMAGADAAASAGNAASAAGAGAGAGAGEGEKCLSCRRIDHGNCEDLYIVRAEGATTKSVKDDAILKLQENLKKKPAGSRNMAIICNADTMTKRAQNRLLKTLEEPTPGTVIMLLSENRENLLDTIKSRCIFYRLGGGEETGGENLRDANRLVDALIEGENFFEMKQLLSKSVKSREDAFHILDGLERIYRNLLLEKDPRGRLLKKEQIFRAVELIEEARRDLIMNVNYNYALKNLMLKIGG